MHKLISIIRRIRNAGLRRTFAFLWILPYRLRLKKVIKTSAKGLTCPTRGITIVGPMTRAASTSKVLRDLAYSLKEAGIPFQTLDLDPCRQVPVADTDGILTSLDEFDIRKYDHIVEILTSAVPDIEGVSKSRIAFWEFSDGFMEGCSDLLCTSHVIAMSDFCAEFYRKQLSIETKVTKLLYPFRFNPGDLPPVEEMRTRFRITPDDFMVFFNFDYGSGYGRKNPDGAMKAFAEAFRQDHKAKLVFKTMGAKNHPRRVMSLRTIANELGIADRFIEIDSYLSERELYGLTNACDVYLSLHRGEGFGLTLVEAMALGKPVVCTDWGSTTEFCNSACAMPIPYVMVRPEYMDNPAYRGVTQWADADINAAVFALKQLRNNPVFCRELGERAKASVRDQFSIVRFKKSVEAFLDT